MDTDSLRLFVLAAEKLNISAAGRALGIAPAVASSRLAKLEKELGLQVRLTPPGLPIDEFVRHYTEDRSLDPSEYVCESPWSRVQLTADGRYSPCFYLRVGDSRNQTLQEVWNGPEFRQFRRDIRKHKIYDGCNGCCNLKYVGPKKFGLEGIPAAERG